MKALLRSLPLDLKSNSAVTLNVTVKHYRTELEHCLQLVHIAGLFLYL